MRAPRFPRIERTLSVGVVFCNSTVADKREEEALDNDLRGSVTSVCVRLSEVSKVEGEKVPSGHFAIEIAFFWE